MRWITGASMFGIVTLMGCAKTATKAPPRAPVREEDLSLGASDAQALGRDLIVLADRAHDFEASHRGRAPKGMRDLGVDSLTPDLARSLQKSDSLRVRVGFRKLDGHELSACAVSLSALEEADLNSGEFRMQCRTVAGTDTTARSFARK